MKATVFCCIIAALILPIVASAQSHRPIEREPLVIVHKGKYGYINHKGKIIIRPQFIWAGDFEHGFGEVYACGRYLWIDQSGQLMMKRPANAFRAHWRIVGGKWVLLDASGRPTTAVFDETLPFSDGLAAVKLGEKWGFVDENGQMVIPPKYEDAFYFHEGVGQAWTDTDRLIIDKNGNVLARGFHQSVGIVAEGRVPVSREDNLGEKFGYLDLKGNIAIPLVYDQLNTFSGGLAPVEKDKKWGYIDTKGNTVIPFVFDWAGVFGSGLAPVKIGQKSGFIDRTGKFAFQLPFDIAGDFWTLDGGTDVTHFFTEDRSFGYVNTAGRVIWGPTYEMPDHAPLFGWSADEKAASCNSLPESTRKLIASFPKDE